MANKTLKIKRLFAYTIYQNLRKIPPKEYPTTGEIKSTISVIIPALKNHIGEYASLLEKASDLAVKVSNKELSEEESKIKIDEYNNEWKTYNKEHGNDVVDISLDEEGFKTLKNQFDRAKWGQEWVANIEEYAELSEAFNEAAK